MYQHGHRGLKGSTCGRRVVHRAGRRAASLLNTEKKLQEPEPMPTVQRITLRLWFDSQAEKAAAFYTGILKNSRITQVLRYGKAGKEHAQLFLPGRNNANNAYKFLCIRFAAGFDKTMASPLGREEKGFYG
jgi:hypothetical protein